MYSSSCKYRATRKLFGSCAYALPLYLPNDFDSNDLTRCKVTRLRGEVPLLSQGVNPPKQELQLPIRSTGGILWNHYHHTISWLSLAQIMYQGKGLLTMATQRYLNPSQSSFRMRGPKNARASYGTQARLTMIRHKKLLCWHLLESLLPTPRHILNHQKRTVGDENHI